MIERKARKKTRKCCKSSGSGSIPNFCAKKTQATEIPKPAISQFSTLDNSKLELKNCRLLVLANLQMICKTSNRPSCASRKSSSEKQFPGKLHDMMTYVEQMGLEHIVSWIHNGRGFMVHDPEKIVEILPIFFSQTQYRSFSRQVNMWHFERVIDGKCKGAFVHPYFLRGQKLLCGKMGRHNKLPLSSYSIKSKQLESSVDSPSKGAKSSHFYSSFSVGILSSFIEGVDSDSRIEREFRDGALTSFAGRNFFFVDTDGSPRTERIRPRLQMQEEPQRTSSQAARNTFLAQQA
jgi:hypothetical protein